MNKKKGFTLIELLAVIVILAIILAISIPGISGVIRSAAKGAFESDAKMVLKAVDYRNLINENFDPTTINKDNITDLLGLSSDNYATVKIVVEDAIPIISIVGTGKWDGFIACGTYQSMKVTQSATECGGDLVPPVITVLGDNPTNILAGTPYSDAGATAIDNNDGDLTGNIIVTGLVNPNVTGTYIITYSVEDASQNVATSTRTVNVTDTSSPVITILGSNPITVNEGSIYSDAGATAMDDVDGNITSSIVSSGTVNTSIAGTYTITYNVNDSSGNAALPATRTVIVSPSYFTMIDGAGNEEFRGVTATGDGGSIAVGNSNSTDGDFATLNKGGYDAVITKFDSLGNKVWLKSFGGSLNDYLYSVVTTTDGNFIAVGNSYSLDGDMDGVISKGSSDAIMVKFDTNGNVIWVKNIGSASSDNFYSISKTSDGGYIAGGNTRDSGGTGDFGGIATANDESVIVKLDSNCNIQWIGSIWGQSNDQFYSVEQTTDGGYIAVGKTDSITGDYSAVVHDGTGTYGVIVKFNSAGTMQWIKATGSNLDSVKPTSDGGAVAVGKDFYDDSAVLLPGGSQVIVKYDASGNRSWINMLSGNLEDAFRSVVVNSDGTIMAVGYTWSYEGDFAPAYNPGFDNAVIAKFSSAGVKQWVKFYSSGTGTDLFYSIAPTSSGYVLAGERTNAGNSACLARIDNNGNLID